MTKLKLVLLAGLAAGVVVADSGCLFHRKNKKPKETNAIATETEAEFRARFLDKRVAELTAQGKDAATARQQAEVEFRAKYPYIREPGKK